ncbi:MAG: glycosyltransferase family 4 protein [Flavobacteriaceae bacterium]
MVKQKLIRITTVPLSLEKLLEGQLGFMKDYFELTAVSSEKTRLEAFAKNEGVASFYLPLTRKITPFKDLLAVYKLYLFLRKTKPSIVHSHTPKAGVVGMMAAWMARVPHRLHTVAGLPLMEASGLKRKLLVVIEIVTYRFATKVYPNSKGLKDFILSENLIGRSKISIIGKGSSNGIDTHYFSKALFNEHTKDQLRKSLSFSKEDFVFVFVGRLVKDKGIVELVNAFSALSIEMEKAQLLLVGPLETELDPLPSETLATIEQHPNIRSLGYQQDVRPYFAISQALVFPSYREGFPNVVLQALAMELPTIATNINGCNELVIPNENGFLVPPKNEKALLEAMKTLVTNEALYQSLKQHCRKPIVDSYERQEIWQAILQEYQQLNV